MSLLDFIFPKRCVGCGRIGSYFCTSCKKAIVQILPNESICPVCERLAVDGKTHPRCRTRYTPDGLICFFRYTGLVKKSIKELKYRRVSDLSNELVSLLPFDRFHEAHIFTIDIHKAIIIPIPLHIERLRFRGFNQSEVLARMISEKLKVPVRTDILIRKKKTVAQAELRSKTERLRNIKNVFGANLSSGELSGLQIFLVDDVFTTGATMREATGVLKRAGAESVWAVTIAR